MLVITLIPFTDRGILNIIITITVIYTPYLEMKKTISLIKELILLEIKIINLDLDMNSWATLQIGKGKESWGSGNDIELALNENSQSP